jgi:CelD/BcsL family acetyltransferase involved in cellulose biosynthesis
MRPVVLDVVESQEQFETLEHSWGELLDSAARASPFLAHGWLAERWRFHGEAVVIIATRDGRLVAGLPLAFGRRYGRVVGEFLAGPYAGLDVVLAAGESPELARSLLERARSFVEMFELFGFGEQSVLQQAWPSLPRLRLSSSPALSMPDGWEAAYRRQTDAKTRNHHRRQLKRLEQLGSVEFSTARNGTELGEALDESFRLHDLRWRSRSDADLSGYASEAGRAFHRAVARRLAKRDIVRLTLLRIDGQAIAFHYWLRYRNVMSVHRLAFDPQYARYSPGLLTTLHAIENAALEECTRVEFLRGEERYKLQLADQIEPVYWTAIGQNPLAVLRRAELTARQRLKQLQPLHRYYDHRRKRTREAAPRSR